MAHTLAELQKYLTPDNTDNICIDQLAEMEEMRRKNTSYQETGKLWMIYPVFFLTI